MNRPMIDAVGLSSILTEKLRSFGTIKKGKERMTESIILSILATDIHKPDLKSEMGDYVYSLLNDDEKLSIHKVYTQSKVKVTEVDAYLNGRG